MHKSPVRYQLAIVESPNQYTLFLLTYVYII
jgi:hypothetical protein